MLSGEKQKHNKTTDECKIAVRLCTGSSSRSCLLLSVLLLLCGSSVVRGVGSRSSTRSTRCYYCF